MDGTNKCPTVIIVMVDYICVIVSDAKFWVGRGDKPSPQGIRIPDENGKETPLRRYDKKTIVLTLPGVSTHTAC